MLIEIRCIEFKSNGAIRPPIKFNNGLNAVLGDEVGSNSIGKSTFLMIVDFAFGGDDYVDKSQDVQKQIGGHTLQFAFKFQNEIHYFSRNTITYNRISKCDAEYHIISECGIDEFRKFLFEGYAISLPFVTFRDIVTRYFRIYMRDNLNEKHPLRSVPQEREENSIASLVKLFNMYSGIEELRNAWKDAKTKHDTFRNSIRYDFVHGVTTKKQLRNNEIQIQELAARLDWIANQGNNERQTFLEGLEPEEAKRLAIIKRELTTLRQQKSRLEAKLANIQNNLTNNIPNLQSDFSILQVFFPTINIKKIQEIEGFHSKLRDILEAELQEEQQKTECLLSQLDQGINDNQMIIIAEGVPEGIPKKTLEDYHEIKSHIKQKEEENKAYNRQNELKETVVAIERQLEARQSSQLRELCSTITLKMAEINVFLYDGQKKAPILTIENGKKYQFETPDDTGTGTSYKALVVFDLSILSLTPLPALIHDSVVLKQIADAPLEKILELYQKSGKQVFIALDKVDSYSSHAQTILQQNAVLHLADNENALFGRAWNSTITRR